MRKIFLFIIVVLNVSLLYAATAGEVVQKLESFKTYKADFVQFTEIEGFGEDQYSGKLYIRKGESALWDYEKPYRQFYLFDTNEMKYYDSDTRQMIIQALSPETNVFMRLMLNPGSIEKDFDITLDGNELLLHPKRELGISDIVLTFDGSLITGIRTVDHNGNKTRIAMNAVTVDDTLPSEIFSPEIPEGTEVFQY